VLASDAEGSVEAGVRITAEITAGGGSLDRTAFVTGPDGKASVPWTLGRKPGVNRILVKAPGAAPIEFTAVATAGPVSFIKLQGATQAAAPRTALTEPVVVRLEDSFSNPVPRATVTFAVMSGDGTIEGGTAVSDASGNAQSGRWTLGPTLGTQEVLVRAGAVSAIVSARSYLRVCSDPIPGSCANPMEMVFTRDNQIYRFRADSVGLTRLTSEGQNLAPAWSPDGRRIAFIHRSVSGDSDVWLMDADGSNIVRRTANSRYASVAWSPDGTQLALSSGGLYSNSIMSIIEVSDTRPDEVVVYDANQPVWSPDGRRIAFIRPSGDFGDETVWVMNVDGTAQRQLIPPGDAIDFKLAWSPDGAAIVYADRGRAFVVNVDGPGRREIVSDRYLYGVDWSRDGKWLAVTVVEYEVDWNTSIGYMPITGGSVTMLMRNAWGAAWRP
jgi:hypothetical protein